MKIANLLFAVFLLTAFQLHFVNAQDEKGIHTFKIVGNPKFQTNNGEKTVEYDPENQDHLYITDFNKEGVIASKRQFLFTGKKFNLSHDFVEYVSRKEIVVDGTTTLFNKVGSVEKTTVYREGKLVQECTFYANGLKKSMIPYLNGEYKLWYPSGELSFSGVYKDDLKNGKFVQFDQSGKLLKSGIYQEGKLISGEPVIQDIIFDNPEVPAKFEGGVMAFNEYLTKKSKYIVNGEKRFYLDIVFDHTGKMTTIYDKTSSNNSQKEFIAYILKNCPNFIPATNENISVQSIQEMLLTVSKDSVKMRQLEKVYNPDQLDEWPQFPSGQMAIKAYLSSNLRYPIEAAKQKIQGNVIVAYVVVEDGTVTDVHVVRSVEIHLDAEAVRVVKNMPKYTPGKLNGKPVKVSLALPISFKLE